MQIFGMISVKLYLFASLRDILSEGSIIEVALHKTCWSDGHELKQFLLDQLKSRWTRRHNYDEGGQPTLPPASTLMLAINKSYITANKQIQLTSEDEIALIPPVSGG